MIEQLKISNFTVFDSVNMVFSPKINLIIGENGTGKTHLLKAIYALCAANQLFRDHLEVNNEDLERANSGED